MTDDTDEGPRALIVAQKAPNLKLLGDVVAAEGPRVLRAGTLDEARAHVDENPNFALALVDISGFTREVWKLCERLSDEDVAVVVIASSRTDEVQEATLRFGPRAVLEKPLRKANLKALAGSIVGD